ncbi:MAG: saccharopine dehydrogenase family protein [bacterium]
MANNNRWLIYGAYGYTGVLVAEEALRRGHKPVLAGRSADKLAPLAERLGLESIVFDLSDEDAIAQKLSEFDLVFHAAGPFIHTSAPMVHACLQSGTHYVDITGEIPVFEHNFTLDQQAKQQGIVLMSGVGFDVVPSDCLLKYLVEKIENPTHLELAFASPDGTTSPGTTKSMLEHLPRGIFARQAGSLARIDPKRQVRRIRFSDRERTVMPISWGDLATAYRSTGVPNIAVYTGLPAKLASRLSKVLPIVRSLLSITPVRRLAQKWVEKNVKGPDEKTRTTARCFFWAKAANEKGESVEAWLETPEGYHLTAVAGVRIVEKIFEQPYSGALTPAQAFGADFALKIPDIKRINNLEKDA